LYICFVIKIASQILLFASLEKLKNIKKMDSIFINKKQINYNEIEKTIEKILYEEKNEYLKILFKNNEDLGCTIPLKKISKKNCDSEENVFSIKILKTYCGFITIALSDFDYKFWSKENKGCSWEFSCGTGLKHFYGSGINNEKKEDFLNFIGVKEGDVASLKYNSIKGEISIFINYEFKGIMFDGIDINKDYRFTITLINNGDKIQLIE